MYKKILIIFLCIGCSIQKSNTKSLSNVEILNYLTGKWIFDYEKTVQNLLKNNSLDPEIDIEIYNHYLQKIKNEIPFAELTFLVNNTQEINYQWEFQYQMLIDKKIQNKTEKGQFTIEQMEKENIYKIIFFQESKDTIYKEVANLYILEDNTVRLHFENSAENSFKDLFFKKSINNL